ncbi:hypothetical protein E7X58_19890 [Streptomyces sp. A1499]|nr:hypothetical protein E7X58_19890 [Streptomyces sp. A1499]
MYPRGPSTPGRGATGPGGNHVVCETCVRRGACDLDRRGARRRPHLRHPARGARGPPRGRAVVFGSDAADLVPDDTNGVSDVFVRHTR